MRSALLSWGLGDTALWLVLSFSVTSLGECHPPSHTGKLAGAGRHPAVNGGGRGLTTSPLEEPCRAVS